MRQQPDQRADNSQRPPMGLQYREKIPNPDVVLIIYSVMPQIWQTLNVCGTIDYTFRRLILYSH